LDTGENRYMRGDQIFKLKNNYFENNKIKDDCKFEGMFQEINSQNLLKKFGIFCNLTPSNIEISNTKNVFVANSFIVRLIIPTVKI
jgi:hypothetical protein